MEFPPPLKLRSYAGLFLVTLATMMYEILLTRIFSVTMWYHFAFMAISVAMFGMTVGALIVYLRPRTFLPARAHEQMAWSAFLFSLTTVVSFLIHLQIPFYTDHRAFAPLNLLRLFVTYTVISVPFVFSGIAVCIALTRFPRSVGKLYAADLIGAAFACIAIIYALSITDGPTAVFVVACFAAAGALAFATTTSGTKLRLGSAVLFVLLAVASVGHTVLVREQRPLVKLLYVKSVPDKMRLYTKWNAFSRISVGGDPSRATPPFGWGLSKTYPRKERRVRQLGMVIDATAMTVMTAYDGTPKNLGHLRYDVTNIAHYLRPDAKVLIVGAGGGRDVLSALLFDQKEIIGIEYNEAILEVVNERFGDFTGHLDEHPKVTFVNDEARSYIARKDDRYDILQVSLIDTWAATAAGAFALTENSLYTVEAWTLFLERLTPRGVLTFSRWYLPSRPGEMYRVAALATAALKRIGVENPREHVMIVRHVKERRALQQPHGVGTILVSGEPFTQSDINRVRQVADRMQFDVVLSPERAIEEKFDRILGAEDLREVAKDFVVNITPPTDDSPFFFQMLRLKDALNFSLMNEGALRFNTRAIYVLGLLLLVVIVLTVLCVVVPLLLTADRSVLRGALPFLLYFTGIGFGFLLVELSQLQRLIIFLGHPTYSLSVVLFSLLLAGGCGSYVTQVVSGGQTSRPPIICLLALLAALASFGLLTPYVIDTFQSSETTVRILVAVAILLPLGFFMGMAFPLGMRLAAAVSERLTPWLWGVNGATSVCASVVAVAIALASGISSAYWVGVAFYVLSFLAYLRATQRFV